MQCVWKERRKGGNNNVILTNTILRNKNKMEKKIHIRVLFYSYEIRKETNQTVFVGSI